jgi:lysine 2,3-aminomutase
MAGARSGDFRELVSPFLRARIDEAGDRFGTASRPYLALTRQYFRSPLESIVTPEDRRRHYESELRIEFEGWPVVGIERLYRRTILIEPTTVCAAHCRWCLRGQYPIRTMTRDEIDHAARYIGSPALADDIDEVLVTGGDALMSLPLLSHAVGALRRFAPNVRILRIGSRVPFQDPDRIDGAMLEMFSRLSGIRLELGVNVNHPVEFWPESVAAIRRLQAVGFRVYNQHPLLKGVNDDLCTLVEHYALLRALDIEAHYLFHAIPLRGMAHHRTSLARGLDLANAMSSGGEFSGRAKPRFAVLSDIGKIVVYHDTIVDRRRTDNSVLLRSGFRLADRQRWNPGWNPPPDTLIANDGTMLTWYRDGSDAVAGTDAERTVERAASGFAVS